MPNCALQRTLTPFAPLSARVRLPAGESKAGSVVGLDKHLYIIWNVSCIPGWELV
jgi:hypothetical protein